jgi:Domain of unknown function (DUF4365)
LDVAACLGAALTIRVGSPSYRPPPHNVMPKRTSTHVLGDRAATKVTTIFENCGFAVERLSQDYGEDLLVQTVHEGVVDPSKIWIQVKGRADLKVRRDGTYVERVTNEHALRWARSADLVVMVVWDFHEDRGLWTLPMHQVDQWDLYLLERRTAKLVFDAEDQLGTETAKKLAWESRLMHYNTLVLRAGEFDQFQRIGTGSTSPRSLVPLIAVNFLRLIGFIGHEQIDPVCRKQYDN